ncbi:helix-turn-helix transcriptional regulator [Methanobrevibacter millerae]|uniref:Transcriptional regulator, HxlR family n=1 Tax=Methanobrevibacter millerae TaxID=230361 RepID=A0A1G5UX32_9EURY|nr:transcriptional regulator FilR1 domain-containing protein [Methanobrevibacter millerae]SDA37587.1 transcriptional regulator, HxlR family [Methanobrevibacter millerae]
MTSTTENFNNLNEFQNVKYLLTSSMRTLILVVLYNESKNLNEIRDELKKPSATILHGLKELESDELIKKDKKDYSLTSNGYLLATNVIKLIDNWYSIEKNKIFWNNHDLRGIPDDYLNKLYLLKDAKFVSSTTSDLSNAYNSYVELISTSRELTIILPIYSENHFNNLIKLLKENQLISLTILINSKILKNMRRNRYLKKSLLENRKVTVIETREDLKIFLTFSEKFMALTLFFKDNHYDDSQMLIDKHENALKWSKGVFNAYKGDNDYE